MKHRVRVLRRAQGDLSGIADYLARDAPAVARRVVDGLLSALESLADLPTRGARPRDPRLRRLGFRCLVVGPHLVFYKVLGRTVRVYRVVHGRRAYAHLL
ncbi:MAG: type II toxin-antitoxin system RelE/ParE family toxin [Myxococcota bacterium]